jgi:hypothetical protein
MAVTPETVASRLRTFIRAARQKAEAMQKETSMQTASGPKKGRIFKVYEECLARLTEDELATLDRIVEKMTGGSGSAR